MAKVDISSKHSLFWLLFKNQETEQYWPWFLHSAGESVLIRLCPFRWGWVLQLTRGPCLWVWIRDLPISTYLSHLNPYLPGGWVSYSWPRILWPLMECSAIYRVDPSELWIFRINEIGVTPCNWFSINKQMRIGWGEKTLQQLMKESHKSFNGWD